MPYLLANFCRKPSLRIQEGPLAELTNTIESGIDIELLGGIDIGIDIDKRFSKLLVLVLILIRRFPNYWY